MAFVSCILFGSLFARSLIKIAAVFRYDRSTSMREEVSIRIKCQPQQNISVGGFLYSIVEEDSFVTRMPKLTNLNAPARKIVKRFIR